MRTSGWFAAATWRMRTGKGAGPGKRGHRAGSRLIWSTLTLFVLVLALSSGLALAAGETSDSTPNPSEGISTAISAQPLEGVEIESARTATSDTFLLPNGSHEARIYAAPVNYETKNGNWKPIEESLEPTGGGGFTNGANSFDLSLPDQLGAEPVQLSGEGEWLSSRLMGTKTEFAEVEGATATYEAASSGTSFELSSIPTGVKETIELENASQPSSFHYELDASQGMTPTLENDGSVTLRRKDGTVAALLPPATITDSRLGAVPDGNAVAYKLESTPDGSWGLTTEIDRSWLESHERVWPVIVDPSIEFIGTINSETGKSKDCMFTLHEPGGGRLAQCTSGLLDSPPIEKASYTRYTSGGGETIRMRSALQFDLSEIPPDAWIQSARLNLYDPESAAGVGAVQVRRQPAAWGTGTWQDLPAEGSEISTANRGTAPGWWHFEEGLASVVGAWADRNAANYGLVVKLADESPCTAPCGHGTFSFMSSTSTPEANRPTLVFNYFRPAPKGSKLASPTEGTHTARRLKLESKWTAAGVEGVTYQFREGKTGPFQTIPAELVRNAEGKAVSWPVLTSKAERERHQTTPLYFDAAHATAILRRKGGVVQVRALFEGR